MDKLVSMQVRQKFSVYMIHKQSHKGGGGGGGKGKKRFKGGEEKKNLN